MGRVVFQLPISIILLCIVHFSSAQTAFQVSDPTLELDDHVIRITYDIVNSTPADRFRVGMHITDTEGRTIFPKTVLGDIGGDVTGGSHKEIRWNLEADQLYLNEKIFVELYASVIPSSRPGYSQTGIDEQTVTDHTPPAVDQGETSAHIRSSNTAFMGNHSGAGIMLQSLVVPGMGLSKITGKPHWIRGMAGYACLGGAIYFNTQSIKTYQEIEDYPTYDQRYDQLQKSITQDHVSEILAYSALGIWITDVIWNLTGLSSLKKRSMYGKAKGISFNTDVDPVTFTPMAGITYSF